MYTNRKLKAFIMLTVTLLLPFVLITVFKEEKSIDDLFYKTIYIEIIDKSGVKFYGTGLLYSSSSILTADHLFPEDTSDIKTIKLTNGVSDFNFIDFNKRDKELDLTLINIEESDTEIKSSVNNDKVKYGEEIIFFGNTNGFGLSYKTGYITKPESTLKYQGEDRNVFFISNSVNKGESGSPIFNTNHELIGILSFKMRTSVGEEIHEFSAIIPTESINSFMKN